MISTMLLIALSVEESICTIDRCENMVCSVETPQGFIEVNKKEDYREGKKISCPQGKKPIE